MKKTKKMASAFLAVLVFSLMLSISFLASADYYGHAAGGVLETGDRSKTTSEMSSSSGAWVTGYNSERSDHRVYFSVYYTDSNHKWHSNQARLINAGDPVDFKEYEPGGPSSYYVKMNPQYPLTKNCIAVAYLDPA